MDKLVSIICPVYNEEKYINQCIQSVIRQDLPKDQWELLIIDGMSTDNTRSIVQQYVSHDNILLLDNPRHTVPYALNTGIRHAQGKYICRIDAHTSFPINYVSTLLRYMEQLDDASNVGAACKTLPADNTAIARAIAIACSHPLGVGNSTFRTATVNKPMAVDTVPFGFWHRSLFEKIGMFDEEMTRNQDDEFNARTIQNGGKIYLVPDIQTTYYARDSISKTCKMFYQYGLFKPLVNKKVKHPATIRQFIPLIFVSGLIIGLPLAFIHPVFKWLYIFGLLLYIALTCSIAIMYSNIYLLPVFAGIHISYGWGYIQGILKLITKHSFTVQYNR